MLTGDLPAMTREEASTENRITRRPRPSDSVSKNTDYVLAGAEPGTKLEKAKQLGVRILDGAEFRKMLRKHLA